MSTKNSDLDSVEEELKDLTDALSKKSTLLERLFLDPAFSPLERKAVINKMRALGQLSEVMHRFLRLLIDKGRVMLLPAITEAFSGLIDNYRGRVRAQITSASPLTAEIIQDIKHSLSILCHKEILAKAKVMPELLGGIRIEVNGLIFDGTIKAKMEALKNKLIYDV